MPGVAAALGPPVGRLLVTALVAVAIGSTSGTTTAYQPKLVARATTLNPAPYVPSPAQPVIEEQVIQVSAPTDVKQTPQNPLQAAENQAKAEIAQNDSFFAPGIIGGTNCVVCVRAMTGRSQNGNAGTWQPSHSIPHPGDIMIFRPGQQGAGWQGHVGVVATVSGYTVTLRHCAWAGGQITFASTGLFW